MKIKGIHLWRTGWKGLIFTGFYLLIRQIPGGPIIPNAPPSEMLITFGPISIICLILIVISLRMPE